MPLLPPPPAVTASCQSHVCWEKVHEKRARHWVHAHYFRWARAHLSSSTKGMLFRLRMCESTGNYHATNGSHWGAYQYSWGGTGSAGYRAGFRVRPDFAPPAEQDVRTARFFPEHRGEWECSA